MTRIYSIYALLNPTDGSVFYVGATKMGLHKRMVAHLSKMRNIQKAGFMKKRYEFICELKKTGFAPDIVLLKNVTFDKVDEFESFFYNLFSDMGYEMMQDKTKFVYNKIGYMRNNNL